ncbi:MAG TPA: IS1595 family transposase [Planctomycetaceae bacterium]|jgi:transposase-like protein
METELPESLIEAVRYFDVKICNDFMRQIKWPGGMVCHHCGSESVYELSTRPVLKCRDCKKQFSYKIGTFMEDSAIPLGHWFSAIFAEAHGGVSSTALAKVLMVGQKTAWKMQNRIRQALARKLVQVPKSEIPERKPKFLRARA